MLIPPNILRILFGVKPTGVLHVGAHLAEEMEAYRASEFGRVIWVEAQESLFSALSQRCIGSDDVVLNGLVWSESGKKLSFHTSNNGQSSSVYELADHAKLYPNIEYVSRDSMVSIRLDELVPTSMSFDFINLDVQGSELEALKGLGSRIGSAKWIYSEVNRRHLYSGIPLVGEIDDWLRMNGFQRVVTFWTEYGWGDALYVKTSNVVLTSWLRNVGVTFLAWRFMTSRFGPRYKMSRDWVYVRFRNACRNFQG